MLLSRLLLGRPRQATQIDDLTLDLVNLTVGGIGHRDTRSLVERRLGPPLDIWARRRGLLDHRHLGLEFRLDSSQRVVGFGVFFETFIRTPDEPKEFEHPPWFLGGFVHLPDQPTEADVVALLGEPYECEVDDEEVMLSWYSGARCIGVDFHVEKGTLTTIYVDFDLDENDLQTSTPT